MRPNVSQGWRAPAPQAARSLCGQKAERVPRWQLSYGPVFPGDMSGPQEPQLCAEVQAPGGGSVPTGRGVSREPRSRIQKSVWEADPAGRMRGEGRAGRGGAGPRGLLSGGDVGASGCGRLAAGVGAAGRGKRTSVWSPAGARDLATQRRRCSCGARARGPEERGRRDSPARAPRVGARQVGGWAGRWAWGRAARGTTEAASGCPRRGAARIPTPRAPGADGAAVVMEICGIAVQPRLHLWRSVRPCAPGRVHTWRPGRRERGAGSGTRDAAPGAGRRLPGASRADLATPDAEGLAVF